MREETDISEIVDGDDDIVLIELSQSQYNAYESEAKDFGMNTHEYIEIALKHEQIFLHEASENSSDKNDETEK